MILLRTMTEFSGIYILKENLKILVLRSMTDKHLKYFFKQPQKQMQLIKTQQVVMVVVMLMRGIQMDTMIMIVIMRMTMMVMITMTCLHVFPLDKVPSKVLTKL